MFKSPPNRGFICILSEKQLLKEIRYLMQVYFFPIILLYIFHCVYPWIKQRAEGTNCEEYWLGKVWEFQRDYLLTEMGPTYSDSLCRRYPFKNIRILVQPQSVWNVKPMSHLYFVQFQRNYKVLRLVLWVCSGPSMKHDWTVVK